MHVGTVQGGTAVNIVPADCEVDFEIRNVAQDQPDRILARVLERTQDRMREAPALPAAAPPRSLPAMPTPACRCPSKRPRCALASMLPAGTSCTKVAFGTEGGLFGQLWARTSVLVCGPGSIEVAHKPTSMSRSRRSKPATPCWRG